MPSGALWYAKAKLRALIPAIFLLRDGRSRTTTRSAPIPRFTNTWRAFRPRPKAPPRSDAYRKLKGQLAYFEWDVDERFQLHLHAILVGQTELPAFQRSAGVGVSQR